MLVIYAGIFTGLIGLFLFVGACIAASEFVTNRNIERCMNYGYAPTGYTCESGTLTPVNFRATENKDEN